ncbi:hypothetical protein KY363_03040 [Candidatus Woesearchaeota archaeon]|nr:hypothetical protein [Candidatus Woesearchaeota archaeon]
MPEETIGKITHYFDRIGVAVIKLSASLKVGEKIRIEADIPFVQQVSSMQSHHKDVQEAKAGEEVGMKTNKPCGDGDEVIRLF